MDTQKVTSTSASVSTGNQLLVPKMPRYTYYLSNYQYLGPSVNYAISGDDDKAHVSSPRFGLDLIGDDVTLDTHSTVPGVAISAVPSDGGVTKVGDVATNSCDTYDVDVTSPRFGKANNPDAAREPVMKPKANCIGPDDELCSASVADEYSNYYPDVGSNAEENREPGGGIVIDQPLADKMYQWTSTYASGNMEEFRKKQTQKMQEITNGMLSSSPLEEFPIRCIFVKGETGSDGKFDPLYIKVGDTLANRYQVFEILGNTPFSVVVKVKDDVTGEMNCIKISMPDTTNQAIDEINLLKILNKRDPSCSRGIVVLKDYFYFRGCIFTVLELLGVNLYQATKEMYEQRRILSSRTKITESITPTKAEEKQGWALSKIRQIALDVLISLKYMHGLGIINCDLKPENIVLNNVTDSPIVKLIDFGSSCYIQEQLSNYIQSRSYRAPEVILGLPYDTQIDLWSLGCVLCEIYIQRILFPSDNNATLMASMISLLGVPPVYILQHKMNSTFMVLPNGNVADLAITPEVMKNSQRQNFSDVQSSMMCNMSLSNSSCCCPTTTQAGNKTEINTNAELDSMADLNEDEEYQEETVGQEFTNITPRKYSIMVNDTICPGTVAHGFEQGGKGIKLDIGHGPSNSKCVRIIEPTRCSIEEMLNPSGSKELAVFVDFIQGLLQYDPLERLTAATALSHSFITQK
ncbi:dual specificity protein kinase [Babesia gibsoni]|uniref:Dual specificity protein kinase n=1 Tax=Babesia gibsoni TaxID=33632 RepID=A0AAD8PGP1_BABGI|nr:dual specificity protein kinase [Babesia gibsoni]